MTHIDDQPIDLKHPDQWVLVDQGRERPLGIKLIHAEEIADLLGFGLHGARTETEVACYLARRDMGFLGGIEEKVHRTQRVNDPARPRGDLALEQWRRAFPAERCRQLTAELRILVIQVSLTECISQLSDVIEPCLHIFGHLL